MNVTLSIDERLMAKARQRAQAMGKSVNQLVRDYLQQLAGDDDVEAWITEFTKLSGKGHSGGWRFNRDEIYDRS